MNSNNDIAVSVCIMTYNQEHLIADCIDSVLSQNTNFKFEVIIGEDCSTDSTREVIKTYAEKHPNIIVPLYNEENVGASLNALLTYSMARGHYIAHLDADDYLLPGKLQAQKDFMDQNPNITISFHRTKILFPNNTLVNDNYNIYKNPSFYSKDELILLGAIGTNSSKMFIAKNHQLFMEIYKDISFPVLDYFYNSIIINDGEVGYLPSEPLCVYRRGIGISATNSNLSSYHFKSYDFISKYFNGTYNDYLGARALLNLIADLKNKRDFKLSLEYVRKYTSFRSFVLLKKYLPIIKSLNWPKQ